MKKIKRNLLNGLMFFFFIMSFLAFVFGIFFLISNRDLNTQTDINKMENTFLFIMASFIVLLLLGLGTKSLIENLEP